MDWNRELKIRLASKIAKLDRGNGGDTRQTMGWWWTIPGLSATQTIKKL